MGNVNKCSMYLKEEEKNIKINWNEWLKVLKSKSSAVEKIAAEIVFALHYSYIVHATKNEFDQDR